MYHGATEVHPLTRPEMYNGRAFERHCAKYCSIATENHALAIVSYLTYLCNDCCISFGAGNACMQFQRNSEFSKWPDTIDSTKTLEMERLYQMRLMH